MKITSPLVQAQLAKGQIAHDEQYWREQSTNIALLFPDEVLGIALLSRAIQHDFNFIRVWKGGKD